MDDGPEMFAMPGPLPPGVAAVSSPFHSKPAAESSIPRRNPKLTLSVVFGLIAIVVLTLGMLFAGTSFVEQSEIPIPKTPIAAP